MTTYMRWHGNSNVSEPAQGRTFRDAVCIQVRWGYLAYTAIFTGLLAIFFVAMTLETRSSQFNARQHNERSTPLIMTSRHRR